MLFSLYRLFYDESDRNIKEVKVAAERCGVVGTKMLQFLTMHDGLVSPEKKAHFADVYENCPTHPWSQTADIYKKQYGRSIYEDFDIRDDADTTPIGSGSIGQVYKLYHRELQKYVAVKVKHPGAGEAAAEFVHSITFLLNVVESVCMIPFAMLIREFITNIYKQLDYHNEAANTRHLRDCFTKEPNIIIPEVFSVSDDIIVMSHHDGVPFPDIKDPILQKKVSFQLYLFMLSSFISYDFLHCDMHYGNFKVRVDGDGTQLEDIKIIVYDCGIIGNTGKPDVNRDFILSTSAGDYKTVARLVADPPLEQQGANGKVIREYCDRIMRDSRDEDDNSVVLAGLIKQLFMNKIKMDKNILRSLQGLIICMQILAICTNTFTRIIGSKKRSREVLIVYNHAMLERIGLHQELKVAFEKWFEYDTNMVPLFYEWLEDVHGHRDKDVFIDAMLKLQFVK
jgi:predicted unusual protein kinase regulating ubiquinone biosynthesis (AarF/ABC1/UbiB family)